MHRSFLFQNLFIFYCIIFSILILKINILYIDVYWMLALAGSKKYFNKIEIISAYNTN